MERSPLQQPEPDSRSLVPRLWSDGEPGSAPHASEGATRCSAPWSAAVWAPTCHPSPTIFSQLWLKRCTRRLCIRPEPSMSSPCSRPIRPSYARILGKVRTQPRGRRYQSSPTCVSMSNAAQSRPREERWGLWFCRNERNSSTSPTCQTERRMTSWTCPLFRREFLVPRWPWCNDSVKPKRRKTKLSSAASLESPQLPLHLYSARPSHRLLLKSHSLRYLNCWSPSTPPPLPSRVGWSKKPSASAAAPPAQPAQAAQARKKKRAAWLPLSPPVMQLDIPHTPAPPVWLPSVHPGPDWPRKAFSKSVLGSNRRLSRGVWEANHEPAPAGLLFHEGSVQASPRVQTTGTTSLAVVVEELPLSHWRKQTWNTCPYWLRLQLNGLVTSMHFRCIHHALSSSQGM